MENIYRDLSTRNYSQECKLDFDLNWVTTIKGSITNTPIITHLSNSLTPSVIS